MEKGEIKKVEASGPPIQTGYRFLVPGPQRDRGLRAGITRGKMEKGRDKNNNKHGNQRK
jgi:hypothetical protein